MSTRRALALAAVILLAACQATEADEDLPAGPIHDRHELMEDIGMNTKKIGDALKSGDHTPIAGAADEIARLAAKSAALFPEGSTHAKSRALPAIWDKWTEFERLSGELGAKASNLAEVARAGGDVKEAANCLFGNCKSCHDQFRAPDED